MATPRGSPDNVQRRITFLSRVGAGARSAASSDIAAEVSRTRAASLLLECVGEFFDDCVGEESLTHLSKLHFDVLPCLPTVRKRNAKQFADTDIFHAGEAQRAER